jgi:hypothetical protein
MNTSRSIGKFLFALSIPFAIAATGCAVDAAHEDESVGAAQSELAARPGTYGGACAGFATIACQPYHTCVDDPRDTCAPDNGGADCGGICALPSQVDSVGDPCGGFIPRPCRAGLTCVDDPRDTCDPLNGGADCGGLCIPARRF